MREFVGVEMFGAFENCYCMRAFMNRCSHENIILQSVVQTRYTFCTDHNPFNNIENTVNSSLILQHNHTHVLSLIHQHITYGRNEMPE